MQPSPVAVPQGVIAIVAEAAATAAVAAGAPPTLIGSIVRSVVECGHPAAAGMRHSGAGAPSEASRGMGVQQQVPLYVPRISSMAQCLSEARTIPSRTEAADRWKPSLWRDSREVARKAASPGRDRSSELITLCISEAGHADPVEESGGPDPAKKSEDLAKAGTLPAHGVDVSRGMVRTGTLCYRSAIPPLVSTADDNNLECRGSVVREPCVTNPPIPPPARGTGGDNLAIHTYVQEAVSDDTAVVCGGSSGCDDGGNDDLAIHTYVHKAVSDDTTVACDGSSGRDVGTFATGTSVVKQCSGEGDVVTPRASCCTSTAEKYSMYEYDSDAASEDSHATLEDVYRL